MSRGGGRPRTPPLANQSHLYAALTPGDHERAIAQESEADLVVAANRVFHDAARPSHQTQPMIDRD
jgi:hypothetical protein